MITVDKKTGKNNLGKRFHLDEIYNNPELYAAYPELSDVIVFAEDFNNDGTGGQTSVDADGNIEIAINYNSILNAYRDYRNPKRTLVHEIQHAIQIIEGFSYGGSPATVKEILRDNINAAEEALSKTAKGTSKYQRIQKSIDELKRAENSSDDEETLE
ncbi:MAG: hypothetical protein IJG33_13325, partial [Selenomonadaceae bacterium]|nr:hypothetical protein [Selenomonadaceae bacterium]